MEQLLLTIDFIHKKNVIHRDIKLDNILINKVDDSDQYDVKIADFGLAEFVPDSKQTKSTEIICGTPCYIAPEILRENKYSCKCDIFSLGSLCFNLLTGRYLFNGQGSNEQLIKNRECDISAVTRYLASTSAVC